MSKNSVLVTGACGFIGSHLVEALVERGHSVKAFVQYNSFNAWGWLDQVDKSLLENVEVVAGDIRDYHCVEDAMRDCNQVLHLASLISIPYSYRSPESYIQTNVTGTLNVVQAAKKLAVERVIHTSTSEVYGSAQYTPIDEQHPLQPQSPYSASKIAADQLALSFFYSFDVPVSIIRPFNTYGPRQSARAVIPTLITQMLKHQDQIKLGNLEAIRDFTYVKDTANAFCMALEARDIQGKVINLGTNFEISIGQLFETIAELLNWQGELCIEAQRIRPEKSEVNRLLANNTLAKQCLGWQPNAQGLDGLKLGLQSTIDWFACKENLKFYKPDMYCV